jgi:hypothetical protein
MSTSANKYYYHIYKDGVFIKTHSQNILCKSRRHELLVYQPPEDYKVMVTWDDEDEVEHWSDRMSLADFLDGKEYELRS